MKFNKKYLLPLTMILVDFMKERGYMDDISFKNKMIIVLSIILDIFLWLVVLFLFLIFVLPISFIIVFLIIIILFALIFIFVVLIFLLCFAFFLLNILTLGTPIYIFIFCLTCCSIFTGCVYELEEH